MAAAPMMWLAMATAATGCQFAWSGRLGWATRIAATVGCGMAGQSLGEAAWRGQLSADAGVALVAAVVLLACCPPGSWPHGRLMALCVCGAVSMLGIRAVTTPSVPMGLYVSDPLRRGESPRPGDFVCLPVDGPRAPALLRMVVGSSSTKGVWRGETFVKLVVAVAGDVVDRDAQGRVLVNGDPLPESEFKPKSVDGRPLPPPSLPRTLIDGEVWLGSKHPDGFDSRYFGSVRIDALTCVARPLWT